MRIARLAIVLLLGARAAFAAEAATQPTTQPTTQPATQPATQPTTQPTKPTTNDDDDDGPARLSLPTDSDRAAWRTAGFRVALGAVYGRFIGLGGAPSGDLLGPVLRAGFRLDRDWSILASFEYASTSQPMGLRGLRFAGTLEPTWHITPTVQVALGVGFGGIVEGRTGRPSPDPQPSTLDTSYTFPDASTPLNACSGVGVAAVARVDWMIVIGRRSSTGVSLEVDGQWTDCIQDTGRVEPDTAQPIVREQYWPHVGVSLDWVWEWR
jgi:hypothetical protein